MSFDSKVVSSVNSRKMSFDSKVVSSGYASGYASGLCVGGVRRGCASEVCIRGYVSDTHEVINLCVKLSKG